MSKRSWLAAGVLVLGAVAVYRLTRPAPQPARPRPRDSEPYAAGLDDGQSPAWPESRTWPESPGWPESSALPENAEWPASFAWSPAPEQAPIAEELEPLLPVPVATPVSLRRNQPLLRLAAFVLLASGLATYSALAGSLGAIGSWPGVALVSLAILPATFALVWLALPVWRSSYLLPAALLSGGLAALLEWFELEVTADLAKLAALTAAGWFFLRFFEEVSWVILVALLIVPVDIYSVARGPTRHIIEERPDVFDRLSIAFHVPAEVNYAELGLPDLLFFALFLASAVRFDLRIGLTWIACTAGLAVTLPLAVAFDLSGLPGLPFLSAGFVAANADLFWRRLRRRPA